MTIMFEIFKLCGVFTLADTDSFTYGIGYNYNAMKWFYSGPKPRLMQIFYWSLYTFYRSRYRYQCRERVNEPLNWNLFLRL